MTTYTVQKGDTLGTIAAKFLGTSSRYKEIATANPQLTNINVIVPGQRLNIPTSTLPAVSAPRVSSSVPSSSLAFDQPSGSFLTKLLANKKLLVILVVGVGAVLYMKSKKTRAVA